MPTRPPDQPSTALRHRGRWPPPGGPRVAIVGARRPSPYGEAVAERLATDLAHAGAVVVSGLAIGVDTAAHEGALLAEGCTVAVLGSGVDVVYPVANADLARRLLAAGGALVSEFPEGTPPRREHFPRRNWTIAALSQVVVVVEAAEGSGSLITADAALHLGKQVMAVPGSVFSPLSVGCHQLLRDGAALVQNARDVLAEISGPGEVLPLGVPGRLGIASPPAAGASDPLLRHLDESLAYDPGELARKLRIPFGELVARLSRLELEGRVVRRGAGYVKVHGRGTSRANS
ncbi:MAG: DNA-protecting protein DprA [Candidatus Nephthysia bennettiae]|nr:MAG: DNA-protecting protein DprA [Candidatus Dormibacteraeota bacterium]